MDEAIIVVIVLACLRGAYFVFQRIRIKKETEGMTEREREKYLRKRKKDSYIKSPVINWIVRIISFTVLIFSIGWLIYVLIDI